jgi:Predicted glycosyltransferases
MVDQAHNIINRPFKVFSIVVTYNGMKWIDQCLTSLAKSTIPNHVIVIDNLSSDGTPEHIVQDHPQVELIRSKENLGFGKGNNVGLRKALDDNADFVFLLNQDAWVEQDSIEKLVAVSLQYKEFGILSPMHLMGDKSKLEFKFSEYSSPFYCDDLFAELATGSIIKEVYETKFVNAAAWLISKECLIKVGGFDPLFPHYGEDEDYVERCRWKGFKVGICPQVSICHDSYFSWDNIKDNLGRHVISNLIVLKKVTNTQRSQTLLLTKQTFDQISTMILFRKFARIGFVFKAYWKAILQSSRIKKARLKSRDELAFLK